MKTTCPIVDVHASWMALNPIHGCPFHCDYCFMNGVGNTGIKPNELVTPEEAVDMLESHTLFNKDMTLCLFTTTDAFATKSNIEYAIKLINLIYERDLNKTICFISKCLVPDYFIEEIKRLESLGMNFIFLLSFSGLDSNIEHGIIKDNIKKNFINLHNNNLNVIHYWRPFVPQNSDDETIKEVMNFVSKYAACSIVIGLKVQDSFIDNLDFWSDIKDNREQAVVSEAIWTKNAYQKLYENVFDDYKIFRSTSCAISYVLKRADYNCYLGTKICELNNCSPEQKERCKSLYNNINNLDEIVKNYFKRIEKEYDYNIDTTNKTIKVDGVLSTSEIVSLKFLTHFNIETSMKGKDHYWTTGHISEKDLIL